jgi:hypothetical protein
MDSTTVGLEPKSIAAQGNSPSAAYLDPRVRACISGLARLPKNDIEPGLERLRRDLDSGAWHARHKDLLDLDAIDAGLRLVVRDPVNEHQFVNHGI